MLHDVKNYFDCSDFADWTQIPDYADDISEVITRRGDDGSEIVEDEFVGVIGFEPTTSCSQSKRSSQAELHPAGVII